MTDSTDKLKIILRDDKVRSHVGKLGAPVQVSFTMVRPGVTVDMWDACSECFFAKRPVSWLTRYVTPDIRLPQEPTRG